MCDFLRPTASSSHFGLNPVLSSLFPKNRNPCFPLVCDTKFHTHRKDQVKEVKERKVITLISNLISWIDFTLEDNFQFRI